MITDVEETTEKNVDPGEGRRRDARPPAHVDALDGLRALAILAVVAYHAWPGAVPGGFLGVTVFFVLTGFLTTRSVWAELRRMGRFRFRRYYTKRIVRIVPAVLATIGATVVLTPVLMASLLPKVHADALPAALFVSNWHYIVRQVSYFSAAGLPSPLTHLWFTSLTMQFYLVWPAAFCALARFVRPRRRLVGALGVLAVISTLVMLVLYNPQADTARVYYGLDTRLAELMVGAALGVCYPLLRRGGDRFRSWEDLAAFAAIALFALACLRVGSDFPLLFRGGFLVVAAAAALVVRCVLSPKSIVRRVMSLRPLTYVGTRSFSIFLWHYPLLRLMNPANRTTALPWWGWVLELALVLGVAELSYRVFEAPEKGFRALLAGLGRVRSRLAPVLSGIKSRATGSPAAAGGPAAGDPATGDPAAADPAAGDPAAGDPASADPAVGAFGSDRAASPRDAGRKDVKRTLSRVRMASVAVGAAAVVLITLLPLDWDGMTAAATGSGGGATASVPTVAGSSDGDAENAGDDAEGGSGDGTQSQRREVTSSVKLVPMAEKVPSNLDTSHWKLDTQTGTCDAKVLVIGDSVAAMVEPLLREMLPNAYVDAVVSRQFYTMPEVYASSVANGYDADVVIVALGANGPIDDEDMAQEAINAVKGKPLYFVTVRCPYAMQDTNNEILRARAAANSNVGIIDWNGATEGHDEYLYDDGTHPTTEGTEAYARLVRLAIAGA